MTISDDNQSNLEDTDELAAETRQLLDAATQGDWKHLPPSEGGTIHRVVRLATDDDLPFHICRMEDPDRRNILPGEHAKPDGTWCPYLAPSNEAGVWVCMKCGNSGGVSTPDTDPNTLTDRLDNGWMLTNSEMRAAADGLRQYAAITAEGDQLRELAGFLIDACATHRIDVPINLSLLDLAADIAGGGVLAAADRGVTDGEATTSRRPVQFDAYASNPWPDGEATDG